MGIARTQLSLGCLLVLASCRASPRAEPDAGAHEETAISIAKARSPVARSSADASGAAAPALHPRSPAKAGQVIDLPARAFRAGSLPGDEGRDPAMEPFVYETSVGAFTIDALPYPNDPAQPMKASASLVEAEKACAARGARLCSELEWERACKGVDDDAYVSGAAWDPACDRDPSSCASSAGVRAMGAIREWTSSRFAGVAASAPVLRGGGAHRCSSRAPANQLVPSAAGFRCCKGTPNNAPMPAIPDHALTPFRPMAIDAPHFVRILSTLPELARLGGDMRYFSESDVTRCSDAGGATRAGFTLTTTPISWSPAPGAELLVTTGRAGSSSFVIALWPTGDETYRLAASFIFDGDSSPVALAYDPRQRGQLLWIACPGKRGDDGSVELTGDHRVVIVQR